MVHVFHLCTIKLFRRLPFCRIVVHMYMIEWLSINELLLTYGHLTAITLL